MKKKPHDIHILIPARQGSVGFPFKNRILLKHTVSIIPEEFLHTVTVSTDDAEIMQMARDTNIDVLVRPPCLSNDTASMKSVVTHYIQEKKIPDDDIIVVLYLTYPHRKWMDVIHAILFFINEMNESAPEPASMLCKKDVKTHPYLCLRETDDVHGAQIVRHNLYRRQDYPKCFEISHYICMFKARKIMLLNDNLYNNKTIYYKIDKDTIDVDYPADYPTDLKELTE